MEYRSATPSVSLIAEKSGKRNKAAPCGLYLSFYILKRSTAFNDTILAEIVKDNREPLRGSYCVCREAGGYNWGYNEHREVKSNRSLSSTCNRGRLALTYGRSINCRTIKSRQRTELREHLRLFLAFALSTLILRRFLLLVGILLVQK